MTDSASAPNLSQEDEPLPYFYKYPHPAVTVDVALFGYHGGRLYLLLIQRKEPPFAGEWALPGGFVQMDEGLEEAALRELREETGAVDVYLEQFAAFGNPHRDPRERVISVAYVALLSEKEMDRLVLRAASDASDARWFDLNELPGLAFDHAQIVEAARSRMRGKLEDPAFAAHLLAPEFTLTHLQRLLELVTAAPIDTRNFRRKILESNLVEETGDEVRGTHRPARLYRWSEQPADE